MKPATPIASREVCVALVLIVLWLSATAWARPLALPDEGRYVGVAWEMMRSGDWLTPTLDGLPFFHKPPLFYWITAGAMSLFGTNELAARAAPIFGGARGAVARCLFTRRWSSERTARLTLLALLVQPLFYIGGQFANLDMLVAGLITATILMLAHAALCFDRGLPCRDAVSGAYALAALGMLAKGLIGAVIPALVILAWLATMQRWRAIRSLASLSGVAIFLVIAGPWFIAMQWRFADFMDYFFVVQQFKRFAEGGFNNVQPIWFYPAALLLFSVPGLPWLYRSLKRGFLDDGDHGLLRLLMWLWVAIVVVFFSMPKSKLLGYVLPAVPPLAYLIADGFATMGLPSQRASRVWLAGVGFAAALSVAAVTTFSILSLHSSRHLAAVLSAQRGIHEPVFMLNHYYYDLPFYGRLLGPVEVVDDWSDPDVHKRDNWRKELADAGQFAPVRSDSALIGRAALASAVCHSPVSWVVGPASAANAYPFLSQARAIETEHEVTLWRVDSTQAGLAAALQCPGPAGSYAANE